MEKNNAAKEYYTIDLMQIVRALWRRILVIILCAFIGASAGFVYSSYFITPTYSSSIMLYVNNSSFSLGNTTFSMTSSEITAAQSLVKTYSEILKNRTTLERVIDKSGVGYSWNNLAGMINAAPSNDTEIMKVTVTTTDPYEAAKIANCIAEVLPIRISEIIDGASMEVVDSAIPNLRKVAPSITKYTMLGIIIGGFLSAAWVAIMAILDDTIHDEEYVLQTYEFPILAKIPNLINSGSKRRYGYYYQDKSKTSDK